VTDTIKAALIAAGSSLLSALTAVVGMLWKSRPRRDRRKAFRKHPYGERRKEPDPE
jgi:hypothetical protein